LIALIVGRLRMNTKEALEQYNIIASKILSKENKKSKTQDGAFKESTLEAEMKRVVAAHQTGTITSGCLIKLLPHAQVECIIIFSDDQTARY
jgi:hypothetical protein